MWVTVWNGAMLVVEWLINVELIYRKHSIVASSPLLGALSTFPRPWQQPKVVIRSLTSFIVFATKVSFADERRGEDEAAHHERAF